MARINRAGQDDAAYAGVYGSTFKEKLNLFKLHYTAGEPVETLKPLYTDVIKAFGDWHVAYRQYIRALAAKRNEDLSQDSTPLIFEALFHFQLALDVASLGVLLGEGELLREIAGWMGHSRGTDMLFEALLEPAIANPQDVEEFFHADPYDPLLDAIYTVDTPQEASVKVTDYLNRWYQSFEGLPWHDGHTMAVEHQMPYYGYWAFEAAAVCVIHGIDDTSFRDHLVYPKDLADWARANGSLQKLKPAIP